MDTTKELDILERKYAVTKQASDDWIFFLAIADYIKYISSQAIFNPIVDHLTEQKEVCEKKLQNTEEKTVSELKTIRDILVEKINANKIKIDTIDHSLHEFEQWENDILWGTMHKCEGMEEEIINIIQYLWEINYKNLVSEYVETHEKSPNQIKHFKTQVIMKEWYKQKKAYEREKELALWENWDILNAIHFIIYKGSETVENLQEKDRDTKTNRMFFNTLLLMSDIEQLKKRTNTQHGNTSSRFFKKDKCINKLDRIHLYFIEETTQEHEKLMVDKNKKITLLDFEIDFEDEESRLKIGSEFVNLPTKSHEYYLCKVLFNRDKDERISWDLIYDEMFGEEPDNPTKNKRRIIDTVIRVNERIKKKLNTKDNLFLQERGEITRKF